MRDEHGAEADVEHSHHCSVARFFQHKADCLETPAPLVEPQGLADRIDLLGGAVTAMHDVRAVGEGALAHLLDLVLVGDAVAELVARRTE